MTSVEWCHTRDKAYCLQVLAHFSVSQTQAVGSTPWLEKEPKNQKTLPSIICRWRGKNILDLFMCFLLILSQSVPLIGLTRAAPATPICNKSPKELNNFAGKAKQSQTSGPFMKAWLARCRRAVYAAFIKVLHTSRILCVHTVMEKHNRPDRCL